MKTHPSLRPANSARPHAASQGTRPRLLKARAKAGMVVEALESRIAPAAVITATLTDNTSSPVPVGGNIHYTEIISNTGDAAAINLQIAQILDGNTTLVPGSLNISPLAFDDIFSAVGNTQLFVGQSAGSTPAAVVAGSFLSNDVEFANDLGTADTYVLKAVGATAYPGTGTVTITTTGGGSVTVSGDGTFNYIPAVGFTGADTFSYTITDDGIDGIANNADDLTGTGTVTINVANKVWYVDPNAAVSGDGRSNSPFKTITAANLNGAGGAGDFDGANDYIYLHAGNTIGGLILEANQHLIGAGVTLTVGGFTLKTAGTTPNLSHNAGSTILLSTNNEIRGLHVTNSAGNGIFGSAVGTLLLSDFDVTVVGGTALGVSTSGTITATGANNFLSSTNGTALSVINVNIGAAGLTFKSISAGAGGGSGIILDTTGAAGGLTVTGTGTTVGSGGTIQNKTGADGSTTSGSGVYLNNTGPVVLKNMNLNDFENFAVRANGVTGLSIDNTAITGTNGTTGGSFNESAVHLTQMAGTNSITNSLISGGRTQNIYLANTSGTTTLDITNSQILNNSISTDGNVGIQVLSAGTANVTTTISGNTLRGNRTDSIMTDAADSSTLNANILNNTIAAGTGGNNQGNIGIEVTASGTANVTYQVNGNKVGTLTGADIVPLGNTGINIFAGLNSVVAGAVKNNTVRLAGGTTSGIGIRLVQASNSTFRANVDGNVVSNVGLDYAIQYDGGQNTGAAGFGELSLTNNNASVLSTALDAIRVRVRNGSVLDARIESNTTNAGGAGFFGLSVSQGNTAKFNLEDDADGAAPELAIGGRTTAEITAYLDAKNPGVPGTPDVFATVGTGNGTSGFHGVAFGAVNVPALMAATVPTEPVTPTTPETPDGGTITPSTPTPASSQLTQAQLDVLVQAAIARWEATGLTPEQSALLHNITFDVTDLGGRNLGRALPGHVTLDDNGAGNGWYVDQTPFDDSEFNSGANDPAVISHVDAFTTVLHELGHQLGLDDTYSVANSGSLMYGFLTLGTRHLPTSGQAEGAVPHTGASPDFALSPITIGTLPAGKSVTAVFDAKVNNNTTVTSVSLQGTVTANGGISVVTNDPSTGAANDATVTAIDLPDVTVTTSTPTVTEDAGTTITYTFTRTGPNDFVRTVNFSITGTASATSDYTVGSGTVTPVFNTGTGIGTVTFPAGASTVTFTVTATADTTVEANETAIVNVTAGTGYDVGTPGNATTTLVNDDTDVSVSVAPASVTEDGAGNLVYTFTRVGVTATALTANFALTGTAGSSDYGVSFVPGTGTYNSGTGTGTVIFGAGVTTVTVTVDPTADNTVESDETVFANVTAGTSYNVAGTQANGLITNDDADVTLAIAPASTNEDGVGTLVYTFTRNGFTTNSLVVNFTVGGSATVGSDYFATGATTYLAATGTVTFAAGASTATITINPVDDTTVEGDETTVLTLASGTGYNVVTAGAITGTILNDDTDVTVAVAPASVTEDGAGNLVYTFTRTGVTATALTVNFNVTGTAGLTGDYAVTGANSFNTGTGAGTVTFTAGSNTATVTIDPNADTTVENNETAIVTLATGTGYNVTGSAATGTITNDDTDISVAVAPASVTEDGAGNLVYTFTRTGVTTGSVTVNFNVTGTAGLTGDYALTGADSFNTGTGAGTVTFAAGETTKTVTIDPNADSTVEADETAILTVATGTGYNAAGTAATGTITNDDASISLGISPASVTEDGAGNLVYTFTRTGFNTNSLVVNFSVAGTAGLTGDYALTGATSFNTGTGAGTVTFAAGSTTATITVDPSADVTGEPDETVDLTIASGSGYSITTLGAVTGTILNDDTAVSVAVTPGTSSESTLTPFVYTFTRTGDTSTALTVNFNVGGTATLTNDYTASGAASFNATTGSVVIPIGQSSVTVTLTPVNDATAEASETAILTVAAGSGYSPSGVGATGTILDNDIDLQITKTDGVTTEIPGTTATYTIIVTNAGLSAVSGATVADTFAAILTNVSYTAVTAGGATGFTASGNGNINDTAVNMPAGATITYTVTGTILASATGTLVNTASVTAPAGITDPNLGNNSATDTDTLVPQGDLTITKTDGKTTLVPGTSNTYTIVVTNTGPSNVVGATFADTFPAGFTGVTFIAVGAGGASGFSASGSGNLSETLNLPSGASVTYTVTGNVAANLGGTFSNTATITAPGSFTDTNAGNNSATDSDTLTPQVDLSVTKTDGKTTLVPGTLNTYTIVVTNSGPSDVTGATFNDTFPAGLTGVTYTAVGAGGASGFTANGSGNLNQALNLPSGASVTYTVTGTVSSAATGSFSNTATIFAPGGFTDTNSENNSATDTDTLTPQVDLSITKTDGKTTAVPGTTNIYTIVVSNSGPSDAVGASLADIFPGNFTNVTYTAVGTGGASGFPANGSGSLDQLVNLPSGATITYTVTGTILASATGSLVNTATITAAAGTTDTSTGNNSATDSDTLTAQADLSITKTDGVTSVVPGTQTTYTIVVSNNGPSNTTATVADTFPASLSNVTFTAVGAGGASGFTDGIGNLNQAVTIPSGGSITYTVTGTVNAGATGTLVNTATVTAGGGTTEINAGNNSATDSDTLTPQGDLSIVKTDGVVNVIPGANNTYTIVVSNSGPSNVVGATVADIFPAGFSNVTFTATGAGGATGFTASGNGNLNDTVNIPSGGSITYTVTGKVGSGLTGTLSNTATITAPGGFTDTTSENNSATDTDTLTPQTDLQVIKTDSPDPVIAGTNLTYTITLNNLGLSDAANITLTDILPAGTTFVSLSSPGGYSTTTPAVGGSGTITITSASVAAGSTSVFTLVVSTASGLANGLVLSNTASVSTITADTNEGNNSATATSTVATSADLAITKTDSPDPVFVGNNLTYTITLNNLGSSDAQGVSITDIIPAGLTFVSASFPVGWSASTPAVGANGTVTFTKTSVTAGTSDSFTIVVTATATVGGTGVSNTATVTSATTDPVGGNNSATAETFVGGIDLAVSKSDGITSTIPGAALTYVINYANNGYVTATGVVLTETLPAGTTFNAIENPGWTQVGSSNQFTFSVPSLIAGGTGSVNFVVHVQNVVGAGLGQLANTTTIEDDGTHGGDIDTGDNTATDIDTLNAAPDLQVTITDSPVVALRGGMVAYSLNYSNIGNQDATGAFLTITLPANTFFNPGASTAGWFLDSGNTYKLAVGNVAGGGAGTGTATFTVQVSSSLPPGYNGLSTTGTVDDDHANGTDPNTANNTETELTPIYQGIYVVAPGVNLPKKGAPALVRVFDIASGTEIQIQAYETSYRNSIRVATGDINGDGYDDIITSTITGNGRVRVFDGLTGQQFTGAFAEIAAFTEKGARGAYVASGDVNGDGRDDIIVGSGYLAHGTAKVRVIDGVTGQVTTTLEPFGNRFHGGVRVAVADVGNFEGSDLRAEGGDGRDEIIVSQGYGGNQIKVIGGSDFSVKNTITVGGSRYRGGVFVAAADLTGDGIAELIAGRDRGATIIETFNASTGAVLNTITPFAPTYKLGVRVAAADVNLDGVADIIAGSGGRNGSLVKFFDGVTKTEITGRTFSAFPQYPTGALFVAGTAPVPSLNSWLPA